MSSGGGSTRDAAGDAGSFEGFPEGHPGSYTGPSAPQLQLPLSAAPPAIDLSDVPQQGQPQQRRRNRIRFSCTMCRDKKLKCNRMTPCDQCEKRGIGTTCRFVPYIYPRDESGSSTTKGAVPANTAASAAMTQTAVTTEQTVPFYPQQNIVQPDLASAQPSLFVRHDAPQHASGSQIGPSRQGHQSHYPHQPYSRPRRQSAHHITPWAQHRQTGRQLSDEGKTPAAGAPTVTAAERLRYLEHLVSLLKNQIAESPEPKGQETAEGTPNVQDHTDNERPSSPSHSTEPFGNFVGGTRYVDSDNWEGVLEDVVKLTENLVVVSDEDEDKPDEPDHWDLGPQTNNLALLSGGFPRVSIGEVFRYLPPRPIMDAMISRFFQGKEPAWMIFHQKTFYRQYDAFWREPRSASYSYLALLFMMLAHAAIFYLGGDEPVPGGLGDALDVINACRNRAAHCLAIDDYTRPGKFKVETMALYFGTEYLRQADAPLGTAMVLSITIRLAMHMGYHRDAKHFPHLSVFEGEMRRRTWSLLTEIDKLVSFEFGLPANAKAEDCDAEKPRNLLDEDLDEDMETLPPARPETERTPALYTICKGRIMSVFGDIIVTRMNNDASSLRGNYYEQEILVLDKRLRAAYDALAEPLKYCGAPARQAEDGSVISLTTDPVDLITQRYLIELLYQKSRLVLHRRFLGVARSNARFAYSRWVCVDAATRILRHQYDIYVALLPGGPLSKDRWVMNGTSTHDFLLADMVLCLEISYSRKEAADGKPSPGLESPSQQPQYIPSELTVAKLIDLLQTSRAIWETQRHASEEANRAYKILSQMVAGSTGAARGISSTGKGKGKETASSSESPSAPPNMTTPPHGEHAMPLLTSTVNFFPAQPAPGIPVSAASSPSTGMSTAPTLYDYAPRYSASYSQSPGSLGGTTLSPESTNVSSWSPPALAQQLLPPSPLVSAKSSEAAAAIPQLQAYHPLDINVTRSGHALPMFAVDVDGHAATAAAAGFPASNAAGSAAVPMAAGGSAYPMMQVHPTGWVVPAPYTGFDASIPPTVIPTANEPMEGTTDPTYFADWPLWDNQIQRASIDAMQTTWNEFFAGSGGNDGTHEGQ